MSGVGITGVLCWLQQKEAAENEVFVLFETRTIGIFDDDCKVQFFDRSQ